MSRPNTHSLELTFNQLIALEYIVGRVAIGEVPLVHIQDGHSGMMRLRDQIADLRRMPVGER